MSYEQSNACLDHSALLFCGQFVLGPSFLNSFETWQRIRIDESLKLTVHPELNTAQVFDEEKSLTLLGFILNPDDSEANDLDILHRLLRSFSDTNKLIEETSRYGGRWILIATHGEEKCLFNDALGLRQVFYTNPESTGNLWAISQPGIGADLLDLKMDDRALKFMDSYEFRSHPEYRWPGTGTPHIDIKHLLPNHYLDLHTGACHRYWPDKPLEKLSLDEALEKISNLLQGLMRGAAKRFDLALGVTAGLDSRLVLSTCKEISDKISCITVRQGKMSDDSPDIVVPARLLFRLGLEHNVIRAAASMTPEFSRTFKKNVFLAHDIYGHDAEAILDYFSRKKVAVTGSGAEVGRCSFREKLPMSDKRRITPEDLSRLQKMDNNEFAISHFSDWLQDLGKIHNVKILDLFEWEQGHGNWLAMTQLEFDIAWRDTFTPYNCRSVLISMLSVDEKYRKAPDYKFFKKLILKLWPEILCEPINPGKKKSMVRRFKRDLKSLAKYYVHKSRHTG